jgi:hypothetical protein
MLDGIVAQRVRIHRDNGTLDSTAPDYYDD